MQFLMFSTKFSVPTQQNLEPVLSETQRKSKGFLNSQAELFLKTYNSLYILEACAYHAFLNIKQLS